MMVQAGFTWGAATAAHQIEGAWDADGKGPSVWDHFSAQPGKTYRNQTARIACDHYHRLEEDLAIMSEIGLQAYRFSFSWPRVLPDGDGSVNEAGLAFYDQLIDGLLERGIQPWGTLFHWDYPHALQRRGGWLNPQSPRWFADYAKLMVRRFGDRVQHWITLNEPQMFVNLGLAIGCHAPGLQLAVDELALVVHHVLLAHGRAVHAIREYARADAQVGWAPACGPTVVDTTAAGDTDVVEAARRDQFSCKVDRGLAGGHAIWCDPVFLGSYPEDFTRCHGSSLPSGWDRDLGIIAAPLDFCGLNIYSAWTRFHRDLGGEICGAHESTLGDGFPRTLFDWPVTPEALYWGPKFIWERYGKPVVITENGMSCHDWTSLDGRVHDPQRIDFLTRYLRELLRARADGVDIRGYFHWSLMDNFEWAEGYKHRFGLVHVDYLNQCKRTLKDSAYWYRDVIRSHGAALAGADIARRLN